MSQNVDDATIEPIPVIASVSPKKRAKKVFKFRFMTSATLKSVRRDQVLAYIMSLHRKIRFLLKKSRRYREKIFKLKRANMENFRKSRDVTDARNAGETLDSECEAKDFIADIKDAAQQAQQISGFIYEPTSGLYYDSRTGYYYNAEHGLYYDGNSGCYYSYNQAENKFEFHSQVYAANNQTATSKERPQDGAKELINLAHKRRRKSGDAKRSKSNARKRKADRRSESDLEKEDGELSDDEDDEDEDEEEEDSDSYYDDYETYRKRPNEIRDRRKTAIIEIDDDSNTSSETNHESYSDIAKKYPPSLRIIVQETDMKRLKIGELFLITYKGGSLGREGKHDVIIPDINCSKYHLRFEFDMEKRLYLCTDVGSRNGTIMNGKRMSNTKEQRTLRLDHGTYLQIGQTKLLCHIHDGHTTCGQCEPGLVYNDTNDSANANEMVQHKSVVGDVTAEHKRQLKNLKKRYGLQDEKYTAPKMDAKNDRAEQRRQKVGSSCDHEKTKSASLNTSISVENKGFKMLKSLGWSEGQALGKNEDGLLEPIAVQGNQNNSGLGCEGNLGSTSFDDPKQKQRSKIWAKTHRRYHESNQNKAVDIFKDVSDDSD